MIRGVQGHPIWVPSGMAEPEKWSSAIPRLPGEDFSIPLKAFQVACVLADMPLPEKAVGLQTRYSQNLARLILRELSCSLSLNVQRFESIAPWIGVLGQIVGELDGNLHRPRVAGRE